MKSYYMSQSASNEDKTWVLCGWLYLELLDNQIELRSTNMNFFEKPRNLYLKIRNGYKRA